MSEIKAGERVKDSSWRVGIVRGLHADKAWVDWGGGEFGTCRTDSLAPIPDILLVELTRRIAKIASKWDVGNPVSYAIRDACRAALEKEGRDG